jgi:tetratricopeptide (TPR) repeat protein
MGLFSSIFGRSAAFDAFNEGVALSLEAGDCRDPRSEELARRAIAKLEQAGRIDPAHPGACAALGFASAQLGVALVQSGRLGEALTHLEQALLHDPTDRTTAFVAARLREIGDAARLRGERLAREGRPEEAEEYARLADDLAEISRSAS